MFTASPSDLDSHCQLCRHAYDSSKYLARVLPCTHVLCSDCGPLFQGQDCPQCRQPVATAMRLYGVAEPRERR